MFPARWDTACLPSSCYFAVGFLFSCVFGGFFLFVLLPPGVSLRNSRLAVWPDSGLTGKGLRWELFICKSPYVRHLLGMREDVCQSSVGSFEI